MLGFNTTDALPRLTDLNISFPTAPVNCTDFGASVDILSKVEVTKAPRQTAIEQVCSSTQSNCARAYYSYSDAFSSVANTVYSAFTLDREDSLTSDVQQRYYSKLNTTVRLFGATYQAALDWSAVNLPALLLALEDAAFFSQPGLSALTVGNIFTGAVNRSANPSSAACFEGCGSFLASPGGCSSGLFEAVPGPGLHCEGAACAYSAGYCWARNGSAADPNAALKSFLFAEQASMRQRWKEAISRSLIRTFSMTDVAACDCLSNWLCYTPEFGSSQKLFTLWDDPGFATFEGQNPATGSPATSLLYNVRQRSHVDPRLPVLSLSSALTDPSLPAPIPSFSKL